MFDALGCAYEGLCELLDRPVSGATLVISVAAGFFALLLLCWLLFVCCTVQRCFTPITLKISVSPAAVVAILAAAGLVLVVWRAVPKSAPAPLDAALDARVVVRRPSTSPPLRVVLCLFGVVPRGIRHSWSTIQARVVRPVREAGMQLHIAVFNINTGSIFVDGDVVANLSEVDRVPTSWPPETIDQSRIDANVLAFCRSLPASHACQFRTLSASHPKMLPNILRQLYIERQVGRFLLRHASSFDVAIIACADFWLALNVSLVDVRRAAESARAVYASVMSDALPKIGHTRAGITNGFYIGAPQPAAAVLSRLDDIALWRRPGPHSYESQLQAAFELHGVEYRPTSMHFFKVRANNWVHWNPYLSMAKHVQLLRRTFVRESDRQEVLAAWRATKTAGLKQHLLR